MENQSNIVLITNRQLVAIYKSLNATLKEYDFKKYINDFYISEADISFLDYDALYLYLCNSSVNSEPFKIMVNNCDLILGLWANSISQLYKSKKFVMFEGLAYENYKPYYIDWGGKMEVRKQFEALAFNANGSSYSYKNNFSWCKGNKINNSFFYKYQDEIRHYVVYDIVSECQRIKSMVIGLMPDLKPKQHKPVKGFKIDLQPEQIESLYNQLKGKYIAQETTEDNFKAVFRDNELPLGFDRVKWDKDKSQALLAYFVDMVFGDTETDLWSKSKNCFEVWSESKDCFVIASSLKQSKQNYISYNTSKKPNNHKALDVIIKSI